LIFLQKKSKIKFTAISLFWARFFSNRLEFHSRSSIKQTNRDEAQLIDNQFVIPIFGIEGGSTNK
jgi:hypothetical protein